MSAAVQTFLMFATITVIMAPLLLAYGLPFIGAALLFHRSAPGTLAPGARLAIAAAIAALGIAPAYDAYHSPSPIYVWIAKGHAIPGVASFASFIVTWLAVCLVARSLKKKPG